jgi:AcrR family transcriptional regulator
MALTFGKKGRPPEDLLARQREIYEAVSPLILQIGARQLSMRQAARAACLSIGGLYHYFPTKRDLVLHGLSPEALSRWCHDFRAQFSYLAVTDPEQYLDLCLNDVLQIVRFLRPAFHAALELGTVAFWDVIDQVVTLPVQEFSMVLSQLVPEVNEQELNRIGRAIRRSICAGVLDKTATDAEIRDELHALLEGYKSQASQQPQKNATLSVVSTI